MALSWYPKMKEYLLLDPSVFDPQQLSSAEIRALNRSSSEIITIDNVVFPETIEKQLRLQNAVKNSFLWKESRTWHDNLFNDQKYCLSGWISSHLDIHNLASRLERSLYQKAPSGKTGFLRFFDPAVLQHLVVVLSKSQIGALFYFLEKWDFYDFNGNIYSLEIEDRSCRELLFTTEQWESLKKLDIIKHVVRVWKEVATESLPFDATMQVYYHIEKAMEYGLINQLDVTVYCLLGLTYDKNFDREPTFKKILSECKIGASFAEIVNVYNRNGFF